MDYYELQCLEYERIQILNDHDWRLHSDHINQRVEVKVDQVEGHLLSGSVNQHIYLLSAAATNAGLQSRFG